ncbi:hypothetical protein LTR64_008207 [Lithohypha guttulata]|uniref:uncharacterized protein n=1 Tax=Lithohypha guttulata TaxID=1690604 RepID=UPI002DE1181C|nr:hypothetical protein LTR51_008359 [Lithohypha guttulata]
MPEFERSNARPIHPDTQSVLNDLEPEPSPDNNPFFHQSSPVPDPEDADYTDYTALLQQLPVFEPYDRRANTSSPISESGTKDQRISWMTSAGQSRNSSTKPAISLIPSAFVSSLTNDESRRSDQQLLPVQEHGKAYEEVRRSNAFVASLGTDLQVTLLPKLRTIESSRDGLLSAQLSVEATERQLALVRQGFSQRVKKARDICRDREPPDAAAWTRVQKTITKLADSLLKLGTAEKVLQSQQRRVTLEHGHLRDAVNDLYGLITAGARLGDSEASMEDQLFENRAAPSTSPPAPPASVFSLPHDPYVSAALRYDSALSETKPPSKIRHADTPSIKSSRNSGRLGNAQPEQAASGRARPAKDILDTTRSRSKLFPKLAKSQRPELVCWGAQFSFEGLDVVAAQAETCDTLRASEMIRSIRQDDLQPELSTHIAEKPPNEEQGPSDSSMQIRRGMARKFLDINVPLFHLSDLISMWGSSMSQNTWTDLHWTRRYSQPPAKGRKALDDVVGEHGPKEYAAYIPLLTSFLRGLDLHSHPISLPLKRAESIPSLWVEPDVHRSQSPRSQSLREETARYSSLRVPATPTTSSPEKAQDAAAVPAARSSSEVTENRDGNAKQVQDNVLGTTDTDEAKPRTNAETFTLDICQD